MGSVGYQADRRQNLALNNNPDGVRGRRDCIGADSVLHSTIENAAGSVAKSGWLVTCLRDLERGVEA